MKRKKEIKEVPVTEVVDELERRGLRGERLKELIEAGIVYKETEAVFWRMVMDALKDLPE